MIEDFKILIGYDGSEYAEAALNDLQRAGLPEEADVFVASIAETLIPAPMSYGGVETSYVDKTLTGEAQAREIAAKGAEKLKQNFPGWTVGFDAAAGSASEILLTKADQWKPDLIVVGSQSRGAIGRFFFGSVAQSLVNNALCSVRVVRKPEEETNGANGKAARLIVGVDGSENAEKAVDSIVSRRWSEGTQVRVVSALNYLIRSTVKQFDLVEPSNIRQTEFFQKEKGKTDEAVNRAVAKLEQTGLEVSSVIENQDPRDLLLEQAREWKADCIFVGAKGMSRIGRLLIGSVSASVAARAHCSVEVVRDGYAV